MSDRISKSTEDLTAAISGHVFKLTKDKTDNVSSFQPLLSIESSLPQRYSHKLDYNSEESYQNPINDKRNRSNKDPINNRGNVSNQEINSLQSSLTQNSIHDDLVNPLDSREATPDFFRRTNYENREETSGKRARHHINDVLMPLSRPKKHDDTYTGYDKSERSISAMQAKIDTLEKENMALKKDNSLIKNKVLELEEMVRVDKTQYNELQLKMERILLYEQEKNYKAFQKMLKIYEDAIAKSGKDNYNMNPVDSPEKQNSEIRTAEKISKLMNYLTCVTVNDITENENGILFDCEITNQLKKLSYMFKLFIPNDDTKYVTYTPNMSQFNENIRAVLPQFLLDEIFFSKQSLPVFFWRLSQAMQGKTD